MKRAKHNLSNYKLLTCDMGELVPIGCYEVLPGDTVQQATSALVRCSPLLAPVMHPVHVRIHHWFVPNRLIWDSWEDFITAGPAGTSNPTFPTIAGATHAVGSLADYLGVPTGTAVPAVSALPFRAYQLIFNENYRDEDLVSPAAISRADGVDGTTALTLQKAAWEKDYFTSSRPWEQKGPTVTIPLGTTAPILSTGLSFVSQGLSGGPPNTTVLDGSNNWTTGSNTGNVSFGPNNTTMAGLKADLSGASAITMTALRQAAALQRFEEARARYGSRYTEYLRYLGVKSSDARLARPEYLGGGKQTIQFSEVLATAETGTSVDVGDLKGHGIAAMRSNRYRRFIEEHGYVISLMSVLPKTMYVQGLHKHWNRRTREDFWQKEFETIGQQAVRNKEVYAFHASPDATFGYQDRYDDYRRVWSSIAGEFRTTALSYWHLGRDFAVAPALNNTFVESVPSKRIFASQSTDTLYVMARHNVVARRLVAQTGFSKLM